MANIIQIKGKTTTGAPSLGQLEVRELCFVLPDDKIYVKKDAGTITLLNPDTGAGDMTVSAYGGTDGNTVNNADKLDGTAASLYALKTYVDGAISSLVASSPAALDTLNELAAALGDDANFSATVNASIGTKLDANSTIDGGTIA